jgi:hypothetical protein
LLISTSFFFLTGISSILETCWIILSFFGFSVKKSNKFAKQQ